MGSRRRSFLGMGEETDSWTKKFPGRLITEKIIGKSFFQKGFSKSCSSFTIHSIQSDLIQHLGQERVTLSLACFGLDQGNPKFLCTGNPGFLSQTDRSGQDLSFLANSSVNSERSDTLGSKVERSASTTRRTGQKFCRQAGGKARIICKYRSTTHADCRKQATPMHHIRTGPRPGHSLGLLRFIREFAIGDSANFRTIIGRPVCML